MTIQALKMATDMKLQHVTFEGDALTVILAFNGLKQFEDWRALATIHSGRALLSQHLFWKLSYSPSSSNTMAHNLAKWAKSSLFCGKIDLSVFPPNVWVITESNFG